MKKKRYENGRENAFIDVDIEKKMAHKQVPKALGKAKGKR